MFFCVPKSQRAWRHKHKKNLQISNKYHDLIAITLNDQRESALPDCGLVGLIDAESGQQVIVDTSDRKVRDTYSQQSQARLLARDRLFAQTGVDHIDVYTHEPYVNALVSFFARRKGRR